MTKTCAVCEASFENSWPHAKYCSRKCSKSVTYSNYKNSRSGSGLSTGKIGAIAELLVSADLLTKGYEVFRSVSSSCSCDLATIKGGKLLKIEVRTGYKNSASGKRWTNVPKDRTRFDVLAVSYDDGIEYSPEL